MTQIGVIVNQGKELGGGLEELRAVLADLGHADPPWAEVAKSKQAPEAIADLVDRDGVDRLVAWGGDGTVRRTIHTLIESGRDDVEVGILPAGTSNALARELGIPTDLRQATRIAVECDASPLDLGRVRGEHFAVRAGIGISAVVMREADEGETKDRFGRLAYVKAALRNLRFSPAEVEIEVDGEPWYRGEASGVVVANVGTLLGTLDAFPDASPADGHLDVGVIRAETRLEWARLAALGLTGRIERSPLADTTTADTVSIDLDRALPWHVDGGDRDRAAHFDVCCVPGAVRIVGP